MMKFTKGKAEPNPDDVVALISEFGNLVFFDKKDAKPMVVTPCGHVDALAISTKETLIPKARELFFPGDTVTITF